MAIPFLNSCKKDDPVSCNYATEVQNEVNALSAAASAYGNDPSTANCNAFKTAYQNYIMRLKTTVDVFLPAKKLHTKMLSISHKLLSMAFSVSHDYFLIALPPLFFTISFL